MRRYGCVIAVLLSFSIYVGSIAYQMRIRKTTYATRAQCAANMKVLTRAMLLYGAENDQMLPPADRWCDALTPYVDRCVSVCPNADRDVFVCPTGINQTCGYAFSRSLGSMSLEGMTERANTVMIFESDAGWNAAGDQSIMPNAPRRFHLDGDGYGFADGSWCWKSRKRVPDGTWAKEPHTGRRVTWEPVLKDSEGEQTAAPDP